MSERTAAWRRRAEEATGSRPVAPRTGPGGGVLDDIDALLAADDPGPADRSAVDPSEGGDGREPLL
ncbi:hypothetical protein GCM10023215_19130 [Pseudonocardia yuanmonensis]|uniref:Uncharacterized protein n=1 Tax=Pseudonocardia yuanmonensis TaxID=1095914 RepID=A0ABP8W8T9_9PSEU